jgi:hypothetical protein
MKFSINIPFGLQEWTIFFDIFYHEYFSGVELPVDYLDTPNLPALLKKNNQSVTNVVDIMEPSLLRNAALQDDIVKTDLFEHVNSVFLKKYNFSVENYTFDIGFIPLCKNKNEDNSRIKFLKKYAYALYKFGRTVSIPVNVNSDFKIGAYSEYYFDVIQQSMFNLFKLCLNIFPHDLKKTIPPNDIYNRFIFDINNIRIVYEPDTGNYLTEKLFLFWLEPLIKYNYTGNIIIVPKTRNSFVYENEVKKLSTIIEKLSPMLL